MSAKMRSLPPPHTQYGIVSFCTLRKGWLCLLVYQVPTLLARYSFQSVAPQEQCTFVRLIRDVFHHLVEQGFLTTTHCWQQCIAQGLQIS